MEGFRENSQGGATLPPFEPVAGGVHPSGSSKPREIVPPPMSVIGVDAGAAGGWRHLSRSLRRTIDGIGLGPGTIDGISICGTGTAVGDAATLGFHRRRSEISGAPAPWDFLIGNGSLSEDGGIEITRDSIPGPGLARWLSVALVGDFAEGGPTPAQVSALGELIEYLQAKAGGVPVRPQSRTARTAALAPPVAVTPDAIASTTRHERVR
jgi:hypothetical protein